MPSKSSAPSMVHFKIGQDLSSPRNRVVCLEIGFSSHSMTAVRASWHHLNQQVGTKEGKDIIRGESSKRKCQDTCDPGSGRNYSETALTPCSNKIVGIEGININQERKNESKKNKITATKERKASDLVEKRSTRNTPSSGPTPLLEFSCYFSFAPLV
jgi:hypothetical protein